MDLGAGCNSAAVSIATAPDPCGVGLSLSLSSGGHNKASVRLPATRAACACALGTPGVRRLALEAGGHIGSLAALEGQQHQGEGEEEGLHAGNGCSELTDTDAPILMAL